MPASDARRALLPAPRRSHAALASLAASAGLLALCLPALDGRPPWEPADVFDSHQRRMLDLGGIGSQIAGAREWALRHIKGEGDGVRHASAWLNYDSPRPSAELAAWYHSVTPKHSADDTYFAVEGHQFGYAGLQQVRSKPYFEGKVVFSVWDKGEGDRDAAKVVECGEWAICTRFGGEGEGAKSYVNFHRWTLEKSYGFITTAAPVGGDRVRLEGYFHAEELGGWILLSKIEVRTGQLPWHLRNLYSFTEQWTARQFGESRWAKLGPSFAQWSSSAGEWSQVRTARLAFKKAGTEDDAHVNANVTNEGRQWGLGIGGGVGRGASQEALTVKAQPALPDDLQKWDTLVAEGVMPTGCAGYTCNARWWTSLVRENLSSSRLPRTVVAACFLLALSCYLRYACRIACPIEDAATSCSDEERRSSSSEDPLKAWR